MRQWLNISLGPVLAAMGYFFLLWDNADETSARMAAIAIWMAVWWITEAVPLAVTSMLPLFLYPLLNIMGTKAIAPVYMNHVLFLFVGGFIMAFAMEKWDLHRRIALRIILSIGSKPGKIMLGLMVASYALSMWISNTATTMMMIPTTLAVIDKLENLNGGKNNKLGVGLLLGIAYAASIGGTATLVGTPPNLIFLSQFSATFPDAEPISFLQWFLFGFPVSLVFLGVAYLYLKRKFCATLDNDAADQSEHFEEEYRSLGKMTFEERMIAILFATMAVLWFTRGKLEVGSLSFPGWASLFPNPDYFQDGTVAIFMATLLFLIPSKNRKGDLLMEWGSVKRLPYNIILLFGGGFALAKGFMVSGLTDHLALKLEVVGTLPLVALVLAICLFMTFVTEVTSNMATTQLILPILAAIAIGANIDPMLMMIPATFSASFAFMLPVATAPNTIIFGSEKVTIKEMATTGFYLNLAGVVIMTLAMVVYGRWIFGIA